MRMPGAAAHTTGMAFTARWAVRPGRSRPTGRAEPGSGCRRRAARRRRPRRASRCRRRSHAGSRSVRAVPGGPEAQQRLGRLACPTRSSAGRPRCPPSIVPAAISIGCGRVATSPLGLDRVERQRRAPRPAAAGDGPKLVRPWASRRLVELAGLLAEAHDVEQQLGRVALREVGELVDGQAVEPALDRRQDERAAPR